MNVLYVTHYAEMFGANRALCEVALKCKTMGVNPIVVTLLDGKIVNELKRLDIPCYVVGGYPWTTKMGTKFVLRIVKSVRNLVVNYIVAKRIARICKSNNIDIIHTNSSVVNVGAMAAKLCHIPHVWHVREFGDRDYSLRFYSSKKKAVRYMELNSNAILIISNVLLEYNKPYMVDESKWKMIYDGVDNKNYTVSKKTVNKRLSILFMGIFKDTKNQMELLRALDILVNREHCKEVVVYFCGGDRGEYAQTMREYITAHSLENYVNLAGNVSDVRQYLEKCNVGITASKMEAFGRVTIEYMYGKLCVVASDSGANIEILNDEVAMIYKLGSVEDLARCLLTLYGDGDMIEKYANAGYNYAMTRFSAEENARQIFDVYNSVLNERN